MKNHTTIFLFALLLTLSLTNILIHDFFCHEELHQLMSPLHHSYHHPTFSPLDLIRAGLKKTFNLNQENIGLYPAGFVPSIFHPPD